MVSLAGYASYAQNAASSGVFIRLAKYLLIASTVVVNSFCLFSSKFGEFSYESYVQNNLIPRDQFYYLIPIAMITIKQEACFSVLKERKSHEIHFRSKSCY